VPWLLQHVSAPATHAHAGRVMQGTACALAVQGQTRPGGALAASVGSDVCQRLRAHRGGGRRWPAGAGRGPKPSCSRGSCSVAQRGSLAPAAHVAPLNSPLSPAHPAQYHCVQPRTDRCHLRRLLDGPLPADWWQGAPHRGVLLQEEGRVGCFASRVSGLECSPPLRADAVVQSRT